MRWPSVLVFLSLLGPSCQPATGPLPKPELFSVVGYGDSLTRTEGVGTSYLRFLPAEWNATDRGSQGEFGVTGHDRFQRDLPKLVAADVEVVVLWWGTNDVYSGFYEEKGLADKLVAEVGESLAALQATDIVPVLVVPPPNRDLSDAGRLANQRLEALRPRLLAQAGGAKVVDLYQAFQGAPTSYYLQDGIHLTDEGATFAGKEVGKVVGPLVPSGATP